MTSDDIAEIVRAYQTESKTQLEVARQFRVTPTLVHRLFTENKKQPARLRELKDTEKRSIKMRVAA